MKINLKKISTLSRSYGKNKKFENYFSFKMISPMTLIFILLGIYPIVFSIWVSLRNWRLNIPREPEFVGLTNYIKAFSDTAFISSFGKTAYFVIVIIVFSILIGFSFALLLNNDKLTSKATILILSILPWAIPRVVGALMWKWIFDGTYGVLNAILTKLNIIESYRYWFLSAPLVSLTFIAIVEIWRMSPFVGLVFFAGLQNIPRSLYEAAEIDGANTRQKFRYITLPEMSIIFMTVLILLTTWVLKSFDTIYTLTGGGPGNNTMITYMYIYNVAFKYLNMSYGAALGYILSFVILIFIIIYYRSFSSKT